MPNSRPSLLLAMLLGSGGGCEVTYLAISAGAPATVAVRGVITDCGRPLVGAEVVLRVQQDLGQSRPVDARIGPITTDREGRYLTEVSPSFAVPGQANVELHAATSGELLTGGTLLFTLGVPPKDTVRLDADVGLERGSCS
ncbi:MAG TPA: hypothetical protein VIM84_13550, partial [Gemmatimonadales bacterium]